MIGQNTSGTLDCFQQKRDTATKYKTAAFSDRSLRLR